MPADADGTGPQGARRPGRDPLEGPEAPRVLIADAQHMFADALGLALSAVWEMRVIGEYPRTGIQVVEAAARHQPEVALIDLWLPEMQAPAVIEHVLAHSPDTLILQLSWFHAPDHIRGSLEAGAVGVLPKGLPVATVAEGIRRALTGERPVFAERLRELVGRLEGRAAVAQRQWDRLSALTPRELEVLRLVGAGGTVTGVARRLGIAQSTVRSHLNSIMGKLDAQSQVQAVATARDQGLIP